MDFRKFFTQDALNIQQTLLSFEEALMPYFDKVAVYYLDEKQCCVIVEKYGFRERDWIDISQIIWARDWLDMTLRHFEVLKRKRAGAINVYPDAAVTNPDFTSSKTPGLIAGRF